MSYYLTVDDDRIPAGDTMPEYDSPHMAWRTDRGFISDPDQTRAIQHDVDDAQYGWILTILAFRTRFTKDEKIAIDLAALDDPAATPEQRAAAAGLRVDLKDSEVAQFIDLKYVPTRDGVEAFEIYGLIGAGRAAEILDTPPNQYEVP